MQNASNEKRKVWANYLSGIRLWSVKNRRGIFGRKTPRDVRIQYKDDEDTFVNLNCDEDLVDAFRCLRPVDNSEELYRLSVRVHATATPVQAVNVRTERTIVNEPAKRRCASPTPRKQLHFKEQSTTAETTKYRSPLLFLGYNFDLSLFSTSLLLAVFSLAVAGANNQNGITWSVFCKPQRRKNIITWPEFLNRRLKPTVREAGRKKALVHGRLRRIVPLVVK